MMRTRSARWDAVRGCKALPKVAADAANSAMTSAIGPVGSSSRAGSILETLSGLILADLYAAEIRPNIAFLNGYRYFLPNFWPIAWPILRKPVRQECLIRSGEFGGPCRSRTYDQEIKSLLLYQLS